MKTSGLVRAGVFVLATAGALPAVAETCLFNNKGEVTKLFQSQSYKKLRAPADRHKGLSAVLARRHGNTVLFNGRPVDNYQGLGFNDNEEVINYCARSRAQLKDERSGAVLRMLTR